MEERKILKTEDIRSMSLNDFMKFTSNRSDLICLQRLCEANSDWIIVNMLENIDTIEKLQHHTKQMKEDLWWKVKQQSH